MNFLRVSGTWITLIGFWEIIGGATGGIRTLQSVDEIGEGLLSNIFYVFALAGCALSILAGIAILRRWQSGRRLSLLVQGLQFVQFSFGWVTFEFLIGPRIGGIFGGNAAWWVGVTTIPSVQLHLGVWTPPYMGVNLFAAAAFLYLVGLPDDGALSSFNG